MRFKKIIIHNFMRYKGDNEISFSCDPEKNVTIILGDNTFGKTTIAQAFRWALYGEINKTNYVEDLKDIVLLNNEIISTMSIKSFEKVRVEVTIEDGDVEYEFIRQQLFRKLNDNPDDLSIRPVTDKPDLTMVITTNGKRGEVINNVSNKDRKKYPANCVQNLINTMFPYKLSNYLFFDGERWSESKNKSSDIQQSINTILGVTSLIKMREHLKLGSLSYKTSVLQKLRKSLQGSTEESKRIKAEIEKIESDIWTKKQSIENNEKDMETAKDEEEKNNKILNDNKSMEEDQNELNKLTRNLDSKKRHVSNYNTDIVKLLSECDKYFAGQLLPIIETKLNEIDLEGKDIPGVTSDTIDWLLENKICLCGEKLEEGNEHYKTIMKLRDEVYPNKIGGPAKELKVRLKEWYDCSSDLVERIREKCEDYESALDDVEENEREIERLEGKIDKKLNLEEVRKKYKRYQTQYNVALQNVTKYKYDIENLEKRKDSLNIQLEKILEQDKENAVIYRAISYAEEIYEKANKQVNLREEMTLNDLNDIIKDNFDKMFNGEEKYAKLEKDYKMHMYYKSGGEEKYLSEGEITAINFVYIVSILELARRQKNNEDDKNAVLSLPLVLDAPFSKLGTENITLISKKLPEFAEQVIIFMLDKDWEASGLDKYTLDDYCYRVKKDYSANSSSVGMKEE